jgi:aldehyde dehydrogenase (NAD+)
VAGNHPVVQAVTGDHRTGMALVRAGVDKVSFAGSPAAARKVLAMCAESMIPIVIEGGGKDAMLVHVDAKLDEAAAAAVYGAMLNAGQTAAAVERVYVAEPVYESFLELVIDKAARLRAGGDGGASYGPMTREVTVDVVRRHVGDALERGGRAVVGGLHSFREPFIEPIVLVDVPEDSIAVTEQTYGPVLVVNKVRSLEDAVRKVNATGFGMAVSVFTGNTDTAREVAERLRVGAVTINSVFGYTGMPAVPIGGVGESGFGRLHGADGLREFARPLSIVRKRSRPWLDLTRMDRKPSHVRIAKALFLRRHAR